MHQKHPFFFDAKDYTLLEVVNAFLKRRENAFLETGGSFFNTSLHPHGIKELAMSQEIRVACSVINLFDSLEAGQAQDRLAALKSLHDEVLSTATTTFRYNTGRVLIQIMKNLVRAHGNFEEQLRLAHDFRKAASGRRRIIRAMLRRYHLLEMPEEWNQLCFDNHVHDANTKGRKSPTHLIMDAWIKGIRKLDVVYYNFIEPSAVQELLQAAEAVQMQVRIGVEFQAIFRDRHVQFIWQPCGFHSLREMLAFMEEKPVQHLMRMGKEASLFHHHYVLVLLERYNAVLRYEIGREYQLELEPIEESEIAAAVGVGQTSRTHLAELILTRLKESLEELQNNLKQSGERISPLETKAVEELARKIYKLNPQGIIETWLSKRKNPDVALPSQVSEVQAVPEIMRLLPVTLIDWLTSIRSPCHIVLNLNKLSDKDVLELLYECDGAITHLELFNLKNYTAGSMAHISAISQLLQAINEGSSIVLKKIIRTMIRELEEAGDAGSLDRSAIFYTILKNMAKLQSNYAAIPLSTRVGSDSTSRSYQSQGMGMGFAFVETLPAKARKELISPYSKRQMIPINIEVCWRTTHYPRRYSLVGPRLSQRLRRLPFLRAYNTRKQDDWFIDDKTSHYSLEGNICTLGGFNRTPSLSFAEGTVNVDPAYLNTTVKNLLKFLLGFSLTAATFAYTQTWWFLVWFGPVIWFTITGLRNVLQTMLSTGGIRRSPLLRLNDYISWTRIADSLMFTGISVPLLELGVRALFLQRFLGVNSMDSPFLFFTVLSLVNGAYIASHNLYRGFPSEAVIGNLFRSVLAIPLSVAYGFLFNAGFLLLGWTSPAQMLLLQQGGAVISKLASDSVAAIIEGFADKKEYLRWRYWDYKAKLKQLFKDYEQLDLLMYEKDVAEYLQESRRLDGSKYRRQAGEIETSLIIASLDLMYFWMYQPRARSTFIRFLQLMSPEEKSIFFITQKILTRVQEISQLFVNGLLGDDFARPLAFYLDKHNAYLADMDILASKYMVSQPKR